MRSKPKLEVKLSASSAAVIAALKRVQHLLPRSRGNRRRRSWRCRIGWHHWTAWDVVKGNFRRIERHCRRCGKKEMREAAGILPCVPWPGRRQT